MTLDLSSLNEFRASSLMAAQIPAGGSPMAIDIDLIGFDLQQPRRAMSEKCLAELAESVKAHGVLEPVSLRSHPELDGRYVVNRGERRVRACRLAGLRTVPAFIDERIDPYAQVVENLHREDLSVFDLARFIAMREREGESRAEIARRLRKPASFITEVAGLADAPPVVRQVFEAGRTRDVRVLYQLARGVRDNAAAAEEVLAGDGPISRKEVDNLGADAGDAPGAAPSVHRAGLTRQTLTLLVEHQGRRGWLHWDAGPGSCLGEVEFEDGSRRVLGLAALVPVAWAKR